MSIKQIQVNVTDLALGMYVCSLDRPWSRTPFPLQGFLLRSAQDIESLNSYCEFVYIDVAKGRGPLRVSDGVKINTQLIDQINPINKDIDIERPRVASIEINRDFYSETTSITQELNGAKRVVSILKGNLVLFSKQLASGKSVDYKSLKLSVDAMVDSVLKCPDAFTWLLKLRKMDQAIHDHSLRSALWAVQFARYIGMPKDQISTLCIGTLLKDIGKLRLPSKLLQLQSRNSQQEKEYQCFVGYGVEMLANTHEVDKKVISVIKRHCERIDGSGFPENLVGRKIPFLAQICGIATEYDAISNSRETSKPLTPSQAISRLYNYRNQSFSEELVIEFIQSIGLYPTGTMVELTSGDIGVIFEQNKGFRLQPYVALVTDKKSIAHESIAQNTILIDLKDEQEARKVLFENGSRKARVVSKLAIARDLKPGAYSIDLEDISQEFFQASKPEKESFLSSLKGKFFSRSA